MATVDDDAALGALLWGSECEQDDAAFLRDAIALLEDSSDTESSAPKRPRRSPPVATSTTTTTGRRRKEIAELREQVAALEATKCALRKRCREQELADAGRLVDPAELWEPIAAQQRELSEQATRENARLKRALDEMVRQRDALGCLLRRERARKATAETDSVNSYAASPVVHPARGLRSSEARFEELMGSLRQQYLETPSAMKMAQAAPNHHPLRSSHYSRITPCRTIESVAHVIFPFSYADTVPEVWTALSGVTDDKPGINYSSVDLKEDSFRLEIMIDIQYQRKRAEFHLATVAKRIVEPNRTVIVWTGLAVPLGVGTVSMEGISIRQRGWSVVEPVASSTLLGGSTNAATRHTMFFEDVVLVEDGVQKKSSKTAMLLQYLLNIYELEGGARRQQTENKLFDKAMTRTVQ